MPRAPASLGEALLQAHLSLLEDLRGLEETTRSRLGHATSEIIDLLDKVRKHINEHFRFEEKNGYMESVLKREPHRERTVQALKQEHRELAATLDELSADARGGKSRDETFCAKVRKWIDHVRDHESRENSLVQDVFSVDTSAED